MPAERTELVRFSRPSYVRTAAVSATLGALLGLGAGYLLWGMDHISPRGSARGSQAADPPSAPADTSPAPPPARNDVDQPAAPAASADAGAGAGSDPAGAAASARGGSGAPP
jgi:hypothetical protein